MQPLSPTGTTTRDNLIQAFWTLFKYKRIDQIHIKEITDAAGYNRSTFYQYFTDIYDMVNLIEEDLLAYVRDYAAQNLHNPAKETIVQNFTDLYLTKGEQFTILLSSQGDPSFLDKLKTTLTPVFLQTFHLPQTEQAIYAIDFVISGILSVLLRWANSNCSISSEALVDLLHPLINNEALAALQAKQDNA